jgi:hypothetical protein
MAATTPIQETADGLNARQRAYLLTAYDEDQARESARRGKIGGAPASVWRWIEYGAVGVRLFDGADPHLLRCRLELEGLVDSGTGSTWASLVRLKLVETRREDTGFVDRRTLRPVRSLMVRLTAAGRRVARLLKGEPATRPKAPKPLSLSALRLIEYGQRHPDEEFEWCSPWDWRPPEYVMMLGVAKGLVKRGLLTGEAPHALRITEAGMGLDLASELNWKPRRRPLREPC